MKKPGVYLICYFFLNTVQLKIFSVKPFWAPFVNDQRAIINFRLHIKYLQKKKILNPVYRVLGATICDGRPPKTGGSSQPMQISLSHIQKPQKSDKKQNKTQQKKPVPQTSTQKPQNTEHHGTPQHLQDNQQVSQQSGQAVQSVQAAQSGQTAQ